MLAQQYRARREAESSTSPVASPPPTSPASEPAGLELIGAGQDESLSGRGDSVSPVQVTYAADPIGWEEERASREDVMKPFHMTFPLLLRRSVVNLWRQPQLFYNRITQPLFYTLILACFFAPIGHNQIAIQNTIGLLYQVMALCFIGMLNTVAIFPAERDVFYREYIDGHYSSYAFAAVYLVVSVPLNVLSALVVGVMLTCAVGLQCNASGVFQFTAVGFAIMYSGECLGVFFASAFRNIGFAVNIVSPVISVFCE